MKNMENNIINVMRDAFTDYAGESLINFLPCVGDGLLRSHRKVMYALHENGITNDKSHIKMLRGSAMTMKYYVYGDMSLNQVMKNMGCNGLNYMYIDPKGNFGDKNKKDGVGSAPRYIECKLSKYAEDLLDGIKKHSVQMIRNFDNTCDEPIVLPSKLPNILLNTGQSIATGESSKIPAHNLNEVCDSFISYIKTKNIDKSISMLNGCDLSTGGQILYDRNTFDKIYKTGKGSFTLVGKYKYNEKENSIHIYEIPYETYIEDIDDKIRDLYDKGMFKEIVDVHDGSDKNGLNLVIYLKKGTNVDLFVKKLRKLTTFETTMSCNFTCLELDCKTPTLMNLQMIIEKWVQHRHNCITNELRYDMNKAKKEKKLLLALKQILLDLDKAIDIVRHSNTDEETISKLMKEFSIDKEEAEYVSEVKLRNLNKTWISNRILKIDELSNKIDELNYIINDTNKIDEIIISQLEEGKKKYGKERMTEIIYDSSDIKIDETAMIEDFNTNIILTKENYIKKTQKYSDSQKLKDGDIVLQQIKSTNKSKLIFFTNKANAYYLNAYDLDLTQPSNLGQYLPSILQLEDGEKVLYVASTTDYKGEMIFAFENGKVSKIPLTSYYVKTNRKKKLNAYGTKSPLVGIVYIDKDEDILFITEDKRYMVRNSSLLSKVESTSSNGFANMLTTKGNVCEMRICDLCDAERETFRSTHESGSRAGVKADI